MILHKLYLIQIINDQLVVTPLDAFVIDNTLKFMIYFFKLYFLCCMLYLMLVWSN